MGYFPEKFQGMSFLLKREGIITGTNNLDGGRLDFDTLSLALGGGKNPGNIYASSCRNMLQHLLLNFRKVDHRLDIMDHRTVINRNKRYIFIASFCAYPTFNANFLSKFARF